MSLRNEMQLNGEATRALSNNSAVYASCPNVNYLSNPDGTAGQYSLMAGYSTIGSNVNENNWSSSNNFGNISLLGPSQRKPNAHRRERQLSSSFSGKFSSFYSSISMANEAMEDDHCQGTSIYSPSNSQVSSPIAYRTFSAPTSPTPCYFNQPPQFVGAPNVTNVSENSFIDYDRQTAASQQVNFYPNYPPEQASSQANPPNPVNDYSFPFYAPSNVEQLNKYPAAAESGVPNGSSYYFSCAPSEFNS